MKFFPDNVGCITEVYSVASIRQFTYLLVSKGNCDGRKRREGERKGRRRERGRKRLISLDHKVIEREKRTQKENIGCLSEKEKAHTRCGFYYIDCQNSTSLHCANARLPPFCSPISFLMDQKSFFLSHRFLFYLPFLCVLQGFYFLLPVLQETCVMQ